MKAGEIGKLWSARLFASHKGISCLGTQFLRTRNRKRVHFKSHKGCPASNFQITCPIMDVNAEQSLVLLELHSLELEVRLFRWLVCLLSTFKMVVLFCIKKPKSSYTCIDGWPPILFLYFKVIGRPPVSGMLTPVGSRTAEWLLSMLICIVLGLWCDQSY